MFTTSTDETPTLNLKNIELDLLKTPFSNSEIFTYEIDLPLHATDIGMEIYDDEYFNIPVLKKCIPDTPACLEIPASSRRNMFIVSINNEEPITLGLLSNSFHPVAFAHKMVLKSGSNSSNASHQHAPNYKNYALPSIKFVLLLLLLLLPLLPSLLLSLHHPSITSHLTLLSM